MDEKLMEEAKKAQRRLFDRQQELMFSNYGYGADKEPKPDCPRCGFPMIKIKGKRGLPDFWGCSQYRWTGCTEKIVQKKDLEKNEQSELDLGLGPETCPKCGSILVSRVNGKTGNAFLACPKYPLCKFTKPKFQEKEKAKETILAICESCWAPMILVKRSVPGEWFKCSNNQCPRHGRLGSLRLERDKLTGSNLKCPLCKGELKKRWLDNEDGRNLAYVCENVESRFGNSKTCTFMSWYGQDTHSFYDRDRIKDNSSKKKPGADS